MKSSKVLVPDYYYKFECIGNKCEDHCCKGWTISIDKETYMKYKKTNNINLKSKLSKSINRNRSSKSDNDYGKIKLTDGKCPLFNDKGLCDIYINLGPENMSYTCKTYPRIYNRVNDTIEKSLTLSCIQAAKDILLKKDIMEFNLDLEDIENINVIKKVESLKSKSISEIYFEDLRVFSISIMQDRRFSIEERLAILGLFISNIDKNLDDTNIVEKSIEQYRKKIDEGIYNNVLEKINLESKKNLQLEFLTTTFNALTANRKISSQRYLNNLEKIKIGLKLGDLDESEKKTNFTNIVSTYYKPFMEDKEYIYENYLVNYIFSTLFPLNNTSLLDTYLGMMVQFAMLKMNVIGITAYYKENISIDSIINIIQSFTMALGHDKYLVKNIHSYLIQNKLNTLGHMIVLVGE